MIGGKFITETTIDTDDDHTSSYGQVVWHVLNLTGYRYSGHFVFKCIDYETGARNSWNSFQ